MENHYSTDEVAEILSVPKSTIRLWIRNGKLTALKLGRSYRVRESDLQVFLKEREKLAKPRE